MKNFLEIAKLIKSEYIFNDYDLTDEKLKEITLIFIETVKNKRISDTIVDEFFNKLHNGSLGMFYKQPVSFLSISQKFFDSKQISLAR